jgi:hypothetical protein
MGYTPVLAEFRREMRLKRTFIIPEMTQHRQNGRKWGRAMGIAGTCAMPIKDNPSSKPPNGGFATRIVAYSMHTKKPQ